MVVFWTLAQCRTELLTTVVLTTKGWIVAKQALDSSAGWAGVRTNQQQVIIL